MGKKVYPKKDLNVPFIENKAESNTTEHNFLLGPNESVYDRYSPLELEQDPEVKEATVNNIADKFHRINSYLADVDNPEYQDVEQAIIGSGLTIQEFANRHVEFLDSQKGLFDAPAGSGTVNTDIPDVYAFRNSAWDDFTTSFSNGMKRMTRGIKMIPTSATVFTEDDSWADEWAEEVDDWYKRSQHRVSDLAGQSFFDTGSIRSFAAGMGSGMASLVPQVARILDLVPGLQGVGTSIATFGSFGDIYGSIVQNGLDNGLSIEEASTQGLLVGVPVAAIEKLGMESLIAKGLKPTITGKFSKDAIVGISKSYAKNGMGKEFLSDAMKIGMKDIGKKQFAKQKLKAIGKGFVEGSITEGATEGLQSFIEQVGEIAYDNLNKHNKKFYNTDIKSAEFWKQVGEEAFYGAIIGGGMTGSVNIPGKVMHEGVYQYVRSAVKKGDDKAIQNLKNYSQKQEAKGDITESERMSFEDLVDEMVEMETEIWSNVSSPKARYQAYNLKKTQKQIDDAIDVFSKKNSQTKTKTSEKILEELNEVKGIIDEGLSVITEKDKVHGFDKDSSKIVEKLSSINNKYLKNLKEDSSIDLTFIQEAIREGAHAKRDNLYRKKKLFRKQQKQQAKGQEVKNPITEEEINSDTEELQEMIRQSQGLRRLENYDNNGFKVTNAILEDIKGAEAVYDTYTNEKSSKEVKSEIEKYVAKNYGMTMPEVEQFILNRTELEKQYEEGNLNEYVKPITEQKQETTKQANNDLSEEELVHYNELKDKYKDAKTDEDLDVLEQEIEELNSINVGGVTYTRKKNRAKQKAAKTLLSELTQKLYNERKQKDIDEKEYKENITPQEEPKSDLSYLQDLKEEEFELEKEIAEAELRKENEEDTPEMAILSYFKPVNPQSVREEFGDVRTDADVNPSLTRKDGPSIQNLRDSIVEKTGLDPNFVFDEIINLLSQGKQAYRDSIVDDSIPDKKAKLDKIKKYIRREENKSIEMGQGTGEVGTQSSMFEETEEAPKVEETLQEEETPVAEEEVIEESVEIPVSEDVSDLEEEYTTMEEETGELTNEEDDVSVKDAFDQISKLFGDDDMNPMSFMDKRSLDVISDNAKLMDNPELFNKLVKNFQKVYPKMKVEQVKSFAKKHGVNVVSRVLGNTIYLTDNATQADFIHEIGHIYLDLLGENHPLYKAGVKIIEDSEYMAEVKKLYPDYTYEQQLNESLNNAITERSLDKIQTKFEGTAFDKFVAWAKRFWRRVKNLFGKASEEDILQIMSDGQMFNKMSYTKATDGLYGLDKRNAKTNDEQELMSELAQLMITKARLAYAIDPNITGKIKSAKYLKKLVVNKYMSQYKSELSDDHEGSRIFTKSDIEFDFDKYDVNTQHDQMIDDFTKAMRESNFKDYLESAERSVEAVTKQKLDKESDKSVQEDEKSEQQSDDEIEKNVSDVANRKKVSESIRSIVTSMIGDDGQLISPDVIMSYITGVASNTLGTEGFRLKIKEDAENNKGLVPRKLFVLLESLKKGNPSIVRGIMNEMSSLIQIRFSSTNLDYETDPSGNTIFTKSSIFDKNKSDEIEESVQRAKQTLSAYKNNPTFVNLINKVLKNKTNKAIEENAMPEFLSVISNVIEKVFSQADYEAMKSDIKSKNDATKMYWVVESIRKAMVEPDKNHADGYIRGALRASKLDIYNAMFMNSSGKMQSSSQFGYQLTEMSKRILFDTNFRNKIKNGVFKNNKAVSHLLDSKKFNWLVHDASIRRTDKGTTGVKEYTTQDSEEIFLDDFTYYYSNLMINGAKTDSTTYFQKVGIAGSRTYSTYIEMPRHRSANVASEIESLRAHLQDIYDYRLKELAKAQKDGDLTAKDVSKIKNRMKKSLEENSYAVIDSNGNIVLSKDSIKSSEHFKENLGKYKRTVQNNMSEDAVNMVETFLYNDIINRTYLNNLYLGPIFDRKGASDNVKRMSLINSGGSLIPLSKDILVLPLDISSKIVNEETKNGSKPIDTADSFSVDSYEMFEDVKYKVGDHYGLGENKKDMLAQVNPTTGRTEYIKMSTLSLTNNKVGENNLYGVSNLYGKLGDAIIKLQEKYPNHHIKVIDSNAWKGDKDVFKTRTLEDFTNATDEDLFSMAEDIKKEITAYNYRMPFNLTKDLSKTPLNKQNAFLSTQLISSIFNGLTFKQIEQMEGYMQVISKGNFKVKGQDYTNSPIVQDLMDRGNLLTQLIENSNETGQSNVSALLSDIKSTFKDKNLSFIDNPNLQNIVESFVSSQFKNKGIRIEVPGNFMHMIPNMDASISDGKRDADKTLNYYEVKDGTVAKDNRGKKKVVELGLPWSMFATSEEKAEAKLKKYKELRDKEGDLTSDEKKEYGDLRHLFKTVAVRIPASGPMSFFAGEVKYFINGHSNMVVAPDGFIKASDADYDADKLFVYRAELDKEGNIVKNEKGTKYVIRDGVEYKANDLDEILPTDKIEDRGVGAYSVKNQLFRDLYKYTSEDRMIQGTQYTLSLENLEKIIEKSNVQSEGIGSFIIKDAIDIAEMGKAMNFGSESIGRFAVATKILNLLYQSNERLRTPLNLEINGKAYTLEEFKDVNINDLAVLLQSALDIGNDPVLTKTPLNTENVNIATTLLMLGLPTEVIFDYLEDVNTGLEAISDTASRSEVPSKDRQKYLDILGVKSKYPKLADIKKAYRLKAAKLHPDVNSDPNAHMDFVKLSSAYEVLTGKVSLEKEESLDDYIKRRKDEILRQSARAFTLEYLDDISSDISSLISYVKLDSDTPTNRGALNTSLSSFQNIAENSLEYVTTENVSKRPMLKHKYSMLRALSNVYKDLFFNYSEDYRAFYKGFTEDVKFVSEKQFNDQFNRIIAQYLRGSKLNGVDKNYTKNVESVMMAIKEKPDLSDLAKKKGVKIEEDTLKSLYQAYNLGKMNIYNTILNKIGDVYAKNNIPFSKEGVNNLMETYQELENKADQLKDNMFLQYINVYKNKQGKVSIKVNPTFKNLSPSLKEEVKNGFDELRTEHGDFGKEIASMLVNYQILKNGVEDKMDTIMALLPNSIVISQIEWLNEKASLLKSMMKNPESSLYQNMMIANGVYAGKVKGKATKLVGENSFVTDDFIKFIPLKGSKSDTSSEVQKRLDEC